MVLYLSWLDGRCLVLLLYCREEGLRNLVGNVRDVCASLRGSDGVREGDLLKRPIGDGECDFPALMHLLV